MREKKYRHLKIGLLAAMLLNFLIPLDTICASVVIVAHPSVEANSLSSNDIRLIYSGNKRSWKDGQPIKFVILSEKEIHQQFTRSFLQKTEDQFLRYWRKQIFTGQGSMPKSFKSEKELLKFVANTEGAVGYVSKNTSTSKVKILKIIK